MEFLVQHILPTRVERYFATVPHNLQPVAIEFDFIGPFRSLGQPGDRQAIHGFDEADGLLRQCLFLWHGSSIYAPLTPVRSRICTI